MSTFYIYQKPTKADFLTAIEQIADWFDKNPRRKVARAQVFGGNVYRIRRKSITGDVLAEYNRYTGNKLTTSFLLH